MNEDEKFVAYALIKKNGRTTGLRLITVPSLQHIGGVPLEQAMGYSDRIINIGVQRVTNQKTRKPYYHIYGKQGNTSRYPVVDDKGAIIEARALTIVGIYVDTTSTVSSTKGNPRSSENNYYYVCDVHGHIGYLSGADLVKLHTTHKIANAKLYYMTIEPIVHTNYKHGFYPMPKLTALDRSCNSTVAPEVFNDKAMSDIDITARLAGLARDRGEVMLTEAQFKDIKLFTLCIRDENINKALKHPYTNTERDLVERIFERASIWGSLPKSVYKRFKQLFDLFKIETRKSAETLGLTDDFMYNSPTLQSVLGNISDQVVRVYNDKAYLALHPKAKQLYCSVLKAEPVITNTLTKVVGQYGHLEGLEHRIKTPLSYSEKIYERSRLEEKTTDTAISSINDLLRYTAIFPCNETEDKYSLNTRRMIASLCSGDVTTDVTSGLGMTLFKGKNYWTQTSNPYRGINMWFADDDAGVRFEMQVHTPESYAVKSGEMHELYEERRAVGITPERLRELDARMNELSASLRVPVDVASIVMPKAK